jgi:site-specific DNA-methyltransferase (cytosine-N4-specific)
VKPPYFADDAITLHHGDALEVASTLPTGSVDCVVTSPPYFGLRDYGHDGQWGLEATPAAYVKRIRALFVELARVLKPDGTAWLNLGDSYSGKANAGPSFDRSRGRGHVAGAVAAQVNTTAHAPYKSLIGIPWRVAFALQDDGWIIRNAIVWAKPNANPESVDDRLSARHELLFLLVRSRRYWFDLDPIKMPTEGRASGNKAAAAYAARLGTDQAARRSSASNPGSTLHTGASDARNPGDVWTIPVGRFPEAHFATMPEALATRCVLAGCRPGGVVLDPFSGAGTTGLAATRHGRRYVGIDLNANYLDLSLRTRLAQTALLDGEPA